MLFKVKVIVTDLATESWRPLCARCLKIFNDFCRLAHPGGHHRVRVMQYCPPWYRQKERGLLRSLLIFKDILFWNTHLVTHVQKAQKCIASALWYQGFARYTGTTYICSFFDLQCLTLFNNSIRPCAWHLAFYNKQCVPRRCLVMIFLSLLASATTRVYLRNLF